MNKTKAYAFLCGSKGDPTGTQKWFRIALDPNRKPLSSEWQGPFRDSTDAENAAEDIAKVDGLDLSWIYD